MKIWNPDSDQLPEQFRHGAVTVGNFDGVHRGHAEIIRRMKAHGLPAAVFTFARHPRQVLNPAEAPQRLTSLARQEELLHALGVETVIFAPTESILSWTPEIFFQCVIADFFDASLVVEGPDFHFGKGRTGTTLLLERLCLNSGRRMEIAEELHAAEGIPISSSRIRELISLGKLSEANALLTAPYRLTGTVIHGEARGRTLGFPTANLGEIQTLLPGHGVYACRAILEDGRTCPAAVHIGPNVTFGETETKVEIHLLDFSGDVYGETLSIDFHSRLRKLETFPDRNALIKQIDLDISETRKRILNF